MTRNTTDDSRHFSIFFLKKKGFLDGSWCSSNIVWSMNGSETGRINFTIDTSEDAYLNLSYKVKDYWQNDTEWRHKDYRVGLQRFYCNFGGFRWFFSCPHCGSRVAVLYLTSGLFVCRKCAQLTYPSCNENKRFRGGIWGMWVKSDKAYEYYQTLRRRFYRGKPTRKYRRYLKMDYLSDSQAFVLEREMQKLLTNKT